MAERSGRRTHRAVDDADLLLCRALGVVGGAGLIASVRVSGEHQHRGAAAEHRRVLRGFVLAGTTVLDLFHLPENSNDIIDTFFAF